MIPYVQSVWRDKQRRVLFTAQCGLAVNLLSALGHGALGLWMGSAWYLILGAYYAILAVMRFGTVRFRGDETFILRFCGWMLIFLAVVLGQTVVMGRYFDKAVRHHRIVMIALAAWTFYKMTLAIINVVRARRSPSPRLRTIRSIACVSAAASVVTLQRSMLATFGGISSETLFNTLTGSAACIYMLLTGVNMIANGGLWKMAKSKLVQANEQIAKAVTEGFSKIADGVTGGYKKIEDKFVDQFLTREGETIEDAKARLKAEEAARLAAQRNKKE